MATTSRFPDWCMFDPYVFWIKKSPVPDDAASTILQANSDTSQGCEFSISAKLADPPLVCRLLLQEKVGLLDAQSFELVVAHRDALLLRMIYLETFAEGDYVDDPIYLPMVDYFIYRIGGGSRPSLERLVPLDGSIKHVLAECRKDTTGTRDWLLRRFQCKDMGFLCRGEEEFAVAELVICDEELPVLNLLRCTSSSSPRKWEVKHPEIIQPQPCSSDPCGRSWFHGLPDFFEADIVVPFGDNYLCWVNYLQGILLCDVFADNPKLRCLQLPALPKLPLGGYSKMWRRLYQVVSVTKGGVLKFVKVDVKRDMKSGIFTEGFTVTSWILRATGKRSSSRRSSKMMMEPWEWVQDGFVTSDKLSDLVKGFTEQHVCTPPHYPLVSMDDPNIIYFVLSSFLCGLITEWVFSIDMSKKTLVSSYMHVNEEDGEEDPTSPYEVIYYARPKHDCDEPFLPAEFSKHLHKNLLGTRTDPVQAQLKRKRNKEALSKLQRR